MNKSNFGVLFCLLCLWLQPVSAHAESAGWMDNDRDWTLRLTFGRFKPEIDSQFSSTNTAAELPYESFFGNDNPMMFNLGVERFLYTGFGSWSLGMGLSSWSVEGSPKATTSTSETSDTTELCLYPLTLELSLYFDNLVSVVPLVPFARVGFDYVIWDVLDGNGDTAQFSYTSESGTAEYEAFGATQGWHYSLGLLLLLDTLDPRTADDFERDAGVKNTYLGLEYRDAQVDDFGSRSSFRLGGKSINVGLFIDI